MKGLEHDEIVGRDAPARRHVDGLRIETGVLRGAVAARVAREKRHVEVAIFGIGVSSADRGIALRD